MKIRLLSLLLLGSAYAAFAQLGGQATYEFLNLYTSARTAALGGSGYAFEDGALEQGLLNPALITDDMGRQMGLNYTNYLTDINYGEAAYSFRYKKAGTFVTSIKYINYGRFERADPTGLITGEFTASDLAMNVGYAYVIDSNFSVGATAKLILSNYDRYTSSGLGTDWAFAYRVPRKNFTTTLILRNLGFQFMAYDQQRENLPFEIAMSLSQRLKHTPIRFYLTAENLQQLDLSYKNPGASTVDPSTGNTIEQDVTLGNKILRHFVVGSELFTSKALNIRLGYNFRRQSEMKLVTRRSNAGFTWGVGLKLKKFRLDYARVNYHVAGASNQFSFTANLDELLGF